MVRRRKHYPDPPPTPEGMVYMTILCSDGVVRTKLVPAEELHKHCKRVMDEEDRRRAFRPNMNKLAELGLAVGRSDDD